MLAGFVVKNCWLLARGNWYRYGNACVGFGPPISLREHLAARGVDLRALAPEARKSEIEALGHTLMGAVGRVVPALPVSLVATVLVEANGQPLTLFELKGRVAGLIAALEQSGAHVHIPRQDRDYAIEVGLRMLVMRRLMICDDSGCRAEPREAKLLQYYANAIAHLLPDGRHDGAATGTD